MKIAKGLYREVARRGRMANAQWICLILTCLMLSCAKSQHYDVDRSAYPIKGIDISAHNGTVDFAKAKSDSVEFVMIKATEGTDFSDALFARNHAAAHKAGLKVGAYHFFRFDSPGHLQAYNFLSAIADRAIDLPLAIDVEEWGNASGVPEEDVIVQLQRMVNVLEAAGHRVIVYTNKQGYERYVEPTLYGCQLWICDLQGAPDSYGWKLWQHSHKGRVAGISGDVDLNTFNGSWREFAQWAMAQ